MLLQADYLIGAILYLKLHYPRQVNSVLEILKEMKFGEHKPNKKTDEMSQRYGWRLAAIKESRLGEIGDDKKVVLK